MLNYYYLVSICVSVNSLQSVWGKVMLTISHFFSHTSSYTVLQTSSSTSVHSSLNLKWIIDVKILIRLKIKKTKWNIASAALSLYILTLYLEHLYIARQSTIYIPYLELAYILDHFVPYKQVPKQQRSYY